MSTACEGACSLGEEGAASGAEVSGKDLGTASFAGEHLGGAGCDLKALFVYELNDSFAGDSRIKHDLFFGLWTVLFEILPDDTEFVILHMTAVYALILT